MDASHFFEALESQFKNKLPFVVFRKPEGTHVKAIFQDTDALFFVKDFTESGFVFAPFDSSKQFILIPENTSKSISYDDITIETLKDDINDIQLDAINKQQHLNLVEKGIDTINNGTLLKVVLSRNECVKISNGHPIHIFKHLLSTYKNALTYCWYHPKIGLWLGATPETLLKIEGQQLSTMSLAGTQEFKGNMNVEWSPKEIEEQHIVTEFISQNVLPLIDSLKVSDIKTIKAGNLLHLKTDIRGKIKQESSVKDVIMALHPTPATCGLPVNESREFILKNEKYNREYYTGFLGELNVKTELKPRSSKRNIENRAYTIHKKQTELFVNLRCMQLKNNTAIIYVGGGITKDSISESEWEETVSKSLVMKKVLSSL